MRNDKFTSFKTISTLYLLHVNPIRQLQLLQQTAFLDHNHLVMLYILQPILFFLAFQAETNWCWNIFTMYFLVICINEAILINRPIN